MVDGQEVSRDEMLANLEFEAFVVMKSGIDPWLLSDKILREAWADFESRWS